MSGEPHVRVLTEDEYTAAYTILQTAVGEHGARLSPTTTVHVLFSALAAFGIAPPGTDPSLALGHPPVTGFDDPMAYDAAHQELRALVAAFGTALSPEAASQVLDQTLAALTPEGTTPSCR